MKKLLIAYHSRTGNTEAMARAVYEGAMSAGATAILKNVAEATGKDLLECDAVVFGSPNNFHYMSGIMKEFFDQAWLTIRKKVANKPYSAITSADSGVKQALDAIDDICNTFNRHAQFNFTKYSEGIAAIKQPSPAILEECRELGRKMSQ